MSQIKGSYRGQMQDGDHSDGHYITLFAEQLTRTFEVLVLHLLDFRVRNDLSVHLGHTGDSGRSGRGAEQPHALR